MVTSTSYLEEVTTVARVMTYLEEVARAMTMACSRPLM